MDPTTPTTPKKRTITLTDRRPVTIVEDNWPVVASAKGDDFAERDSGRHQQALANGECAIYHLTVRQHSDGRLIVYATNRPGWRGGEERKAGELLMAGEDIVFAIHRVASGAALPNSVIRECIANLSAEELE